jgi:hypothetical protein
LGHQWCPVRRTGFLGELIVALRSLAYTLVSMRVDRATAMTALPVMFFFDALGVGLVLMGYTVTGLVVVMLGGLAFLGVCLYVERKRRPSE